MALIKDIPTESDINCVIQHRNTRHDAIDIVNSHFAKANKSTRLWSKLDQLCNEITRDIQNMPQRKPNRKNGSEIRN